MNETVRQILEVNLQVAVSDLEEAERLLANRRARLAESESDVARAILRVEAIEEVLRDAVSGTTEGD